MDGLGYNLIEIDSTWYYNCNYKGYSYQVAANESYIDDDVYDVYYYDLDENLEETGEQKSIEKTKKIITDEPSAQGEMISYFNSTVKNSVEYKTWCAANFGKALGEVEFYVNDADLKEAYSQYNWENEVDEYGNPLPLNEVIGKTIKTTPDGKLMVLN